MIKIEGQRIFSFQGQATGHPRIGRSELSLRKSPPILSRPALEIIRTISSTSMRRLSLVTCLNNNSPRPSLGLERGSSAYFTYNPSSHKLIIEWAQTDAHGSAKTHNELNRKLSLAKRKEQGMVVRSGHLATIGQERTPIALLDSLSKASCPVPSNRPEHRMVHTLWQHGFIVVASDGRVAMPETMAKLIKTKT